MFDQTLKSHQDLDEKPARDWVKQLAAYRSPNAARSWFEVAVTVVPFVALWALAWGALSISPVLTVVLALLNAPFLVRLFAIQHDCGHASFFENRKTNDWLGRVLGVVTVTPYAVWRHTHSVHHGASGNLDRRGMGDIHTMTVREYKATSPLKRLQYRLYRNPIFLFVISPGLLFLLSNRWPWGLTGERRYWISAMGTNAVILAVLGVIYAFGGWAPILLIFLPSTLLAATIGVWLFYVQHQFEHAHWEHEEDWQIHEAALHGSSHYVLPPLLQWLSANIGIHHVHHLYSRIPFYRLPEVLRDHTALAEAERLTIRESLEGARLHLWDEEGKRLLSYREAWALPLA